MDKKNNNTNVFRRTSNLSVKLLLWSPGYSLTFIAFALGVQKVNVLSKDKSESPHT